MPDELQAIREIHGKISDQVSLEDFRSKIEDKIREHYGLLSEVGAAKLLAREMGATFEAPQISFKIKNLVPGMQSVDLTGRVVRIYGVRNFERETGSGKVSNLLIMDETGNVRVVLWGEKAEPVERNAVKRGDVVQIRSGYTRTGLSGEVEVHVGRRGRLLVNPAISEPMPELQETKVKISDIKVGDRDFDVEGVVSGLSNVRTFSRPDGISGRVATLFLRDETGEIRVSLWNEKTEGIEEIRKGTQISISGGYTKTGFGDAVELHCSSNAEITIGSSIQEKLPEIEVSATPLSELVDGMQSVDVEGRVQRKLGRRTFTRLDGKEGKVANLIMSDETAEVRLVLWGDGADMLDRLVEGSRIAIENGYTKLGLNQEMELHVGWRGRVVPQIEEFSPLVCDMERGMEGIALTAGVVEVGLPEEFEDAKLVSAVIGDASGRVPAVFWDGHVEAVQDLDSGTMIRITNGKVNDMGEVQVLPESSLEVLDESVEVLDEDEPRHMTIAEVERGVLCRIRGAPIAVTDLRYTSSFGLEKLVCSCRIDDGSGQVPATVFGLQVEKLLQDGHGRSTEELRGAFRTGADALFVGVVVDGRLRVREVEVPDPRSEVAELLGNATEAS
jgi:replication factor A1